MLPSNSTMACTSSEIRESGSFIRSCLLLISEPVQLFFGDREVVERENALPGGLCALVTFAGDEHDIAGLRLGERLRDRFATVRLENVRRAWTLQARESIIHDRERIFTPWIIRGEHGKITAIAGGFAHHGTLRAVAVAAEPKDGNNLPASLGNEFAGQRGEVPQRVVGVSVIHHNREWLAFIDAFEPAGNTLEGANPARDLLERAPASVGGGRGGKHVMNVNAATHRRKNGDRSRRRYKIEAISGGADIEALGAEVALFQAVGEDLRAMLFAEVVEPAGVFVVVVRDGDARWFSPTAFEEDSL